jgi:hypothetical protein
MASRWIIKEIQSNNMCQWKQAAKRNQLHIIFCTCCTMDNYQNGQQGKRIDVIQAFPQAKLKEDIYLQSSTGYKHMNDEWLIKLKPNLYGLAQASRNWL